MTTRREDPVASEGVAEPGPALSGVRVVEIAAGIAVAYCGKLFAQAGAEVVRIESPGGDTVRRWGPFAADRPDLNGGGLHRELNAGKRSVALDVRSRGGADLAGKLIASSQILLTSWKTDARLPLAAPDELRALFPNVAYLSISEFGFTGPYAGYTADSHVIEALAGNSYVSGDPDREPLSSGVELADYFAAVTGWVAGLASMAAARRDGSSHFVDVSMLESLAMADDHNLVVYLGTGAVRRRYYSRILVGYPSDIMRCKDGYIAFVPGGGDFANTVSQLLDRPDLASHPLFLQPQERVIRWREFDAIVKPWLESHTVEEVLSKAEALHLAFANVPTVKDLLEDEHLRARHFWRESPDGAVLTGPGALLSETPLGVRPAPKLGADTAELLGVQPDHAALLWRAGE